MRRVFWLALSILLLPVGWLIGAALGYWIALQPAREAANYAETIAESYARQIQAAIDPRGTRFIIPITTKQEVEPE